MNIKKKKSDQPNIVIFLHNASVTFIAPELELLQVFPLNTDTVAYQNVINKNLLHDQLTNFISQIGLQPGNCVLIFDQSVYFLKETEVTTAPQTEQKPNENQKNPTKKNESKTLQQTDAFVEQIKNLAPYENAFVKDIIIGSTHYTIVVNRNFYEPVLSTLTELGFFVSTLIPSIVIQDLIEGQQFSLELGSTILNSGSAAFKKHNFLSFQSQNQQTSQLISHEKPETKKIVALITIFLLLIGILVYMVINMDTGEELEYPPSQDITNQAAPPTTSPISTPIPVAEATIPPKETIDLSVYSVKIFNGSGKTGQAGALKTLMLEKGFTNVETGNTATLTASKAVVVFNSSISELVKQMTSQMLVDAGLSISPITSSETEADIVITTVTSSNLSE